ncbi:MAG: rod shape-determining protein MreC [Alphaproteobacteria bacterium]|nr:rod shape-determining protein MreC [Alphaproteobacteria bacterium]
MRSRKRWRYLARVAPARLWDGRSSVFFLFASVALLLVSALRPSLMEPARVQAAQMFAPVMGSVSRPFQEIAAVAEDVAGVTNLRTEVAMLKQENARLREWYQAAMMLEAENKSLQELLNIRLDPRHSFVTARVVADSGNAYVHSLLVAAGIQDGIEKGQAVLSGDGLVGRIVEAGDDVARVLLLTDFNSRIPVMIEGSRQKAILTGTNDELPVLKYLPPDANVADGARVVTSGHGGLFPPGLPVGTVEQIEGGEYVVKVFANMDRVIYVRVVDRPVNPNLQSGIVRQ